MGLVENLSAAYNEASGVFVFICWVPSCLSSVIHLSEICTRMGREQREQTGKEHRRRETETEISDPEQAKGNWKWSFSSCYVFWKCIFLPYQCIGLEGGRECRLA